MEKGESYTLKLSGTKSKVKWKSSNKKIATVSSKGVVKGISAGTTKIIATANNKNYTCKVTIKKATYVTVTISNSFTNAISEYFSEMKVVSSDDNTTTFKMTKSLQQKIYKNLSTEFENESKSGLPYYYEKLTADKKFTSFKIYVDKEEYYINSDYDYTPLALLIWGLGMQQLAGVDEDDIKIKIEIIDKDTGKVIDSLDTSEYF